MSKTSRSKSKNFEILYYNLKEEYDQLQKDNDEICKEYESTIQMLTDSINELQKQRNSMTKKYNQLEKEKENLQDRNREKINDIQNLDQKNQKLSQENINIKNKFKEKEHQIVILENDTEHYLNLIRQNEAVIDELNYKLEEALEDNVTIQTEFEIYKQIMGEKLSRKSDELKEIKSDMFTKNLMIKKLKNKKQDNKFIESKYLDLNLNDKSTQKKHKNNDKKIQENKKIYQQRLPNTYTRDNNYSITCNNNNFEIDLFNNISINSIDNINKNCITQINGSNNTNYDSINISEKIIPYKEKEKTKNISNYLFNSYNNKMNSLALSSSKRMNKLNSKNYSFNLYKKSYDNDNKYQEINKFDLSDIDYNDTTSGLNVFQNTNDELDNHENYNSFLPNLESGKKIEFNDEFDVKTKYNKRNSNAKTKPFKNAFVRKLLTSKKLDNNLEKLYNYNQRNRESIYNKLDKLNQFNVRRKLYSIK